MSPVRPVSGEREVIVKSSGMAKVPFTWTSPRLIGRRIRSRYSRCQGYLRARSDVDRRGEFRQKRPMSVAGIARVPDFVAAPRPMSGWHKLETEGHWSCKGEAMQPQYESE